MLKTYAPPKEMQDLEIWTPVLRGTRDSKGPESYFKKTPLTTWPVCKRKIEKNPDQYAPVVGICSTNYLVIDVDDKRELPNTLLSLLKAYPTFRHLSKSGTGWHIYYNTTTPLPKKKIIYKYGEIYCGAFVTTTDPDLSDFSQEQISSIDIQTLQQFIPFKLPKSTFTPQPISQPTQYPDPSKILIELKRILAIVPVDVNPALEVIYDLKFKDLTVDFYSHWLYVSLAIADFIVSSNAPQATVKQAQQLFVSWSSTGQSFKSAEDCIQRLNTSIKQTQAQSQSDQRLISFNFLRKLCYSYKVPVKEFPTVVKTQNGLIPDPTDPENYVFLTNYLGIEGLKCSLSGQLYIKASKSLIRHFFTPDMFNPNLSTPFPSRFHQSRELQYSLIRLFRQFGIKKALAGSPLTAGLVESKFQLFDPILSWVDAKPWDGKPRIKQLIRDSIELNHSQLPEESFPSDMFYHLILKHLTLMAGLRRKALTTDNTNRLKVAQAVLILEGPQNTHKSTWIRCLLPNFPLWTVNTTPSTVQNTLEIQRALSNSFVFNIDEIDVVLQTINLSDFKNFITQEFDSYRKMYSEQLHNRCRATGLFGTTNAKQLRLDKTGNRRFWIIPIKRCDAVVWLNCDYQQVWAEVFHLSNQLTLDDWGISQEEEAFVNKVAKHYITQNSEELTLEMALNSSEESTAIYTGQEIDYKKLLNCLDKTILAQCVTSKIAFSTYGQKALKYLNNITEMFYNIKLKNTSFQHNIATIIQNTYNIENYEGPFGIYENGLFISKLFPGRRPKYHILPFKKGIDDMIQQKMLPPSLLFKN